MKQKNLKMMISGITVAVVLVVVGMLAVLVWQFVYLGRLKAEAADLDAKVKYLKDYNSQAQSQIDFYNNAKALEDYFHSQGYGYDGDTFIK